MVVDVIIKWVKHFRFFYDFFVKEFLAKFFGLQEFLLIFKPNLHKIYLLIFD